MNPPKSERMKNAKPNATIGHDIGSSQLIAQEALVHAAPGDCADRGEERIDPDDDRENGAERRAEDFRKDDRGHSPVDRGVGPDEETSKEFAARVAHGHRADDVAKEHDRGVDEKENPDGRE